MYVNLNFVGKLLEFQVTFGSFRVFWKNIMNIDANWRFIKYFKWNCESLNNILNNSHNLVDTSGNINQTFKSICLSNSRSARHFLPIIQFTHRLHIFHWFSQCSNQQKHIYHFYCTCAYCVLFVIHNGPKNKLNLITFENSLNKLWIKSLVFSDAYY